MTNHNPAFTSSAATGGFTETANTSADGGTTEIALAVLPAGVTPVPHDLLIV